MYSMCPWVKCRLQAATVMLVLGSSGIILSPAADVSYAGANAPPPGVAAADIEYHSPIIVNGAPVTATISTPNKKGLLTFEGTAGQRITIGFSGVTLTQFKVVVYRPDGGVMATQPSAVKQYYATMYREPSPLTQVQTSTTSYQLTGESTA